MGRSKANYPAHVVIVGCGRLGSMLASELSRMGIRVMIIDRNSTSFALPNAGFSGFRVTGNAVELDVLRAANLTRADCLLTTTEKDTVNLMVAKVEEGTFRSVPPSQSRL